MSISFSCTSVSAFHSRLTFAAPVEDIPYSDGDFPTGPIWPWLPGPITLKRLQAFGCDSVACCVITFLHHMVNLLIRKRRACVTRPQINSWLGEQLWRQTLFKHPHPSLLSGLWCMAKVTVIIIHRVLVSFIFSGMPSSSSSSSWAWSTVFYYQAVMICGGLCCCSIWRARCRVFQNNIITHIH